MARTTIKQLPTKVEFRDDDAVLLEDKSATFNTPLKRFGNHITKDYGNGLKVENGRIYLTNNGDIININSGVKIDIKDTAEFASDDEISALFDPDDN